MKNVLMTGATGMIGSLVLQACLLRPDVDWVTSIVRRPSGHHHPKLREIVHANFRDYSAITGHFDDQDICFFCLGVYTSQVDAGAFSEITVDYTEAFANTVKRHSPDAVFCFLSGQGADRTEKSLFMYARDKGAAENYLLRKGFDRLHIFQPGYIYPVTPRREPNFSYRLMRALYKPVSALYPNIGVTSEMLARAMVRAAFDGYPSDTLENREIRRIGQ